MLDNVLMIQGTSSDAGKSTVVAGLCHWLARQGARVAPFKPQNMALNSAVTADGGEIGRAQALQALACGIDTSVHMNPILLKPATDQSAQVIVQGRALDNLSAQAYHAAKKDALKWVKQSFAVLQEHYSTLLVEGAGSPAEINLRAHDIANMGFAEAVDCPVVLVADIDRGGVFAQLVGTLELLSASERARVIGLIINKFRGDPNLLQSGLQWLENKTGKPVLGVLPYLPGLHLDAEDAIDDAQTAGAAGALRVAVPVLGRISNHTDFDSLRGHPDVNVQFVAPGRALPACDLVILPGSKNVRADLALVKRQWQEDLLKHLRYGGKLLGICGGYQMLGQCVADPQGIEGPAGEDPGLGLLALETKLLAGKTLRRRSGRFCAPPFDASPCAGYEIHCGVSRGPALERPLLELDNGETDGAVSADGQVAGTYLHGIGDHPEALNAILRWAGAGQTASFDLAAERRASLGRLADSLDTHLSPAFLDALRSARLAAAEGPTNE